MHRRQLPIKVVIGKEVRTPYCEIVRRRSWRDLAWEIREPEPELDALHCPVLGVSEEEFSRRQEVARRLGMGRPFGGVETIRLWLQEDLHEGQWCVRWLDLMSWACGCVDKSGEWWRLMYQLAKKDMRVVFLFHGLEEVFRELDSSEAQRRAVRALLQEVPDYLVRNGDNIVGVLIFVRRSTVTSAVRENSGQLMALYQDYSLS
jgi:hypothetical protein